VAAEILGDFRSVLPKDEAEGTELRVAREA
jgi:hypothetical protein